MRYGERRSGRASLKLAVPSALPSTMRGPIVELRSLKTEPAHRRQGHAQRLMTEVTKEADRHARFLFLAVEPTGDMTLQDLANFYGRHGFVPIQADPLLMVRPYTGVEPRI